MEWWKKLGKKEVLDRINSELDPDIYQGIDCLKHLDVCMDTGIVTIKLELVDVEEDDYVGFSGY